MHDQFSAHTRPVSGVSGEFGRGSTELRPIASDVAAAVDFERGPGYDPGVVARENHRGVRDVVKVDYPSERDGLGHPLGRGVVAGGLRSSLGVGRDRTGRASPTTLLAHPRDRVLRERHQAGTPGRGATGGRKRLCRQLPGETNQTPFGGCNASGIGRDKALAAPDPSLRIENVAINLDRGVGDDLPGA